MKIIFKVGLKEDIERTADADILVKNFDVNELHQKLYEMLLGLRKAHKRIDELEKQIKNNHSSVEKVESFEDVAAGSPIAQHKLTAQ